MKLQEQRPADDVADPLQQAVTVAAAQISLVLQEAQPSVEQLGASVSRMIVTLGSRGHGPGALAGLSATAIAELQRDAARATVTLQFYDRMTQNLSHLQDYLASVATLLAKSSAARDGAAGEPCRHSPEWLALREGLLRRLVPDAQQPPAHGIERAPQSCMGAVELF
jgi:hypothetical protein